MYFDKGGILGFAAIIVAIGALTFKKTTGHLLGKAH